MGERPLQICGALGAGATPNKTSRNLLGVSWWHIPVVDRLLIRCPVEVVPGSAEKGLALLGDKVTGWDSVLLPCSVTVSLALVKLWRVTGVGAVVPEAKVRSPDVNTVTSEAKGV